MQCYLVVGNLEIPQFLHRKIFSEPLNKFSVVPGLTKGDGWTAKEYAAFSGHLEVVTYLAHQWGLPSFFHI